MEATSKRDQSQLKITLPKREEPMPCWTPDTVKRSGELASEIRAQELRGAFRVVGDDEPAPCPDCGVRGKCEHYWKDVYDDAKYDAYRNEDLDPPEWFDP